MSNPDQSLDFDANSVEPASGFELLPPGNYTAIIEESEKKATKRGDGVYLQFVFSVIEGSFKGRKLWARITFTNPNATAQTIGRSELSALCRSVGVMTPKSTLELHNRPLVITVGQEKRKDNGEDVNVVNAYKALDGTIAGAVVDGSSKIQAQADSVNAAPKKAPWAKG